MRSTTASILIFAVLYYAAVRFGMALTAEGRAAVFWPPAALLLAALLTRPPGRWWMTLLAMIPVHVLATAPADIRLWRLAWEIGYGGLLAAGAATLARLSTGSAPFGTLGSALAFICLGVLFAPAILALLDPGAFVALLKIGPSAEAGAAWSSAYLCAATGFLALTPAMAIWSGADRNELQVSHRQRGGEIALIALSLGLALWIDVLYGASVPAAYCALLVPVLWAAMRFGFVGASSTVLVAVVVVTSLAAHGSEPFAHLLRDENVANVQLLFLAIVIPIFLLVASVDERESVVSTLARRAVALKEAHERLTTALKAARTEKPGGEHAARQIVGEMHAAVTHQINQPLGAILNNAEAGIVLLQSRAPSLEDIESILIDVRNDALRASEVSHRVRALLQFQELRREDLDMNQLVESVIELIGGQAALRGVVIEVRLGAPAQVHADPVHVEQVLLNLLVNAMDAMTSTPEAMRRIVVETAPTERHTVEVRIADRGSGIAAEKLAEIFEPFRTTKSHGMGMGLSIVRFIVRAHGGNITAANNEDGPGAAFRFELPSAQSSAAESYRAFARRASDAEISSAS